jgi:hypothetical protein
MGQVLQLNITSKPFLLITSLKENSFPLTSFIFLSGLGTGAPISKGSIIDLNKKMATAAKHNPEGKILFIMKDFRV